MLEYERKTEPKYRKPNPYGSCLVFVIALAIAGAIVYYVFAHKEQFSKLWHRATHPDSVSVPAYPDQ